MSPFPFSRRQEIPLIVYDVPHRTGLVVSTETTLRPAAIPGVVGTEHALTAVAAETIARPSGGPDGSAVLAGYDVVAPADARARCRRWHPRPAAAVDLRCFVTCMVS